MKVVFVKKNVEYKFILGIFRVLKMKKSVFEEMKNLFLRKME